MPRFHDLHRTLLRFITCALVFLSTIEEASLRSKAQTSLQFFVIFLHFHSDLLGSSLAHQCSHAPRS